MPRRALCARAVFVHAPRYGSTIAGSLGSKAAVSRVESQRRHPVVGRQKNLLTPGTSSTGRSYPIARGARRVGEAVCEPASFRTAALPRFLARSTGISILSSSALYWSWRCANLMFARLRVGVARRDLGAAVFGWLAPFARVHLPALQFERGAVFGSRHSAYGDRACCRADDRARIGFRARGAAAMAPMFSLGPPRSSSPRSSGFGIARPSMTRHCAATSSIG